MSQALYAMKGTFQLSILSIDFVFCGKINLAFIKTVATGKCHIINKMITHYHRCSLAFTSEQFYTRTVLYKNSWTEP